MSLTSERKRIAAPVIERAFVVHENWDGDYGGIPWPYEIEITRRTAKKVFIKRCQATDFGSTIRPELVFPTFNVARTMALKRIGNDIDHLRRKADKLYDGMAKLLTAKEPKR